MHSEAHALPNAHLFRRDVFHPAHQAKALIAVDQGDIEGFAFRGMHDGRSVDGAEPLADAPFQPIAAGEGTKHPRIKHCASRRGAELKCQFATREMIEVGLKGSVPIAGHDCSVMAATYVCSSVALRRSTVVCSCCAQATTVVRSGSSQGVFGIKLRMSVGLPTAPVREKESMINAPQQQIPG